MVNPLYILEALLDPVHAFWHTAPSLLDPEYAIVFHRTWKRRTYRTRLL